MYERGYIPTPGFEITPQFAYAVDGIKAQGQIRFEYVCGDGVGVGLLRPDRRIRNVLVPLVLMSSDEITVEEHMFDDEPSEKPLTMTAASAKRVVVSQRTKDRVHNELFHNVLAEIVRARSTIADANEALKSTDALIPSIDWHYGQK